MKILNLDSFINEGYVELHKTITDILNLVNIKVRCTWDGETWYYYDRENKGTFEDFKKLQKNNNTNFEIYLRYNFVVNEEDSKPEDAVNRECSVEQLITLHFNNMSENDYDINCKYCHKMDDLRNIVYDYDEDDDEPLTKIRELISKDLDVIIYELEIEVEDKLGIKNDDVLIASIIGEAIRGFMEKFE